MFGLLLLLCFALPAAASVQSALSANVLPSSANLSSYTVTLGELKAADAACDAAWATVSSEEALCARGRALRAAMIGAVGGFPETRCPLNAQTVDTVSRDGYTVEKVLFESWPGIHVTANLFLPDSAAFSPPYPAVILPCGHSTNGKGSDAYQRGCVLAAKAGLACLIYDPFDQGERTQGSKTNTNGHNQVGALAALLGGSMARFRIWDGMRAVDYLETREEIDASRIGCMGNSGGGTMTSLLMSVEPRLKAACPSCYISTLRAVCESLGPQDAEQNIFGQLALGVNHASFAFLQAPMPIRFMFCQGDMFPISGSLESWNVVSNTAARCGIAERYGMTDVPGAHGWKESTRTSSVEWLRRWLCDEPSALKHDLAGYRALDVGFNLSAVDTALSGTAHEVCPGGRVLNLPGERTVYDVMREELAAIAAARPERVSPELVCAVAGIAEPESVTVVASELSRTAEADFEVVNETFTWPNGLAVPAVTLIPPTVTGAPVLIVGNGGRSDRAALAESWLSQGRPVTVADLIATGEIGGKKHTFYSTDVPEEEVAILLYLMGRSLIGEQAGEILVLAQTLKARYGEIPEVVAKGRVCISAIHAAAARRDLVAAVTQVSPPASWESAIASGAHIPFAIVVNGALKQYEWTTLPDHLVRATGSLDLSVKAGVDWRVAHLAVTVSDLSLPYSPSATLAVTAFDASRREVETRRFEVTANGSRDVTFEGLIPASPYTFHAVLTTGDPATGKTVVLAEADAGQVFGLRYDGWIDEDIHTLRGVSAPRWDYREGEVAETAMDGEAAVAITSREGVTFSPTEPGGNCMVIEQRVAFTGPIGTRMDEVMTTAKAGVAIVPGRGGLFRFVLLDNGAWQTNTQVVAEMNRTYLVRMTIDTVTRGVLYDLVKEGGTIHLHSGRYPETAHPTALYYRGNVRLRSVKGAVYKANVAAVGDAEYDSVSNALEHAEGTAVTLLHDASYAPGSNGVFRINAAGYTLVLTGGDYGAFAGWAKRHPEVLDGSRSVSARAARISSQLDLDGLVPDAVLDALRQADVRITRAVLSGDGAVDITLKVAGLPVGEAAEMAYVKRIFAILGSPGNGEPFQADQVVYLADPLRTADGSVRFRVRPDVSPLPKKFFFRGKIEL